MVCFVDETHKDRNSSRRRRAWGKRSSGGVALDRWFRNDVRYSMIVAADIDGFVDGTTRLYRRDDLSSDGASGTVGEVEFVDWVKNSLVPTLGNYLNNEKRSIVVMDNASTHMNDDVERLIRDAGAVLLYTAPYSPDLNPIEKMFNVYKMFLKRHEEDFNDDWEGTHWRAIDAVTKDIAIMEYRKCEVPNSFDVKTSWELQDEEDNDLLLLLTALL